MAAPQYLSLSKVLSRLSTNTGLLDTACAALGIEPAFRLDGDEFYRETDLAALREFIDAAKQRTRQTTN